MTGIAAILHVSRFGFASAAWFEAAEAGLTEAERRRLPRKGGSAWRRHILSRRLVRYAAARLGLPDIQVDYPDHAQPLLACSRGDFGVSISHCCQTAAVVIAEHPVIGCDILSLGRSVRWQHIAALFFDKADYEWMMRVPDDARARFRSLWCVKEAIAKCSGKPLLECLRQDTTEIGANQYWTRSGVVADCAFAVASDVPLVVHALEVPIKAL